VAKYRVTMPDGTNYDVTAPDDVPQDFIRQEVQQQHSPRAQLPTTQQPVSPAAPKPQQPLLSRIRAATDPDPYLKGALQGAVLDPIEGLGQVYEKASGTRIPVPQAARDWFDKYRQNVESTTAGQIGRYGAGGVEALMAPWSRGGTLARIASSALSAAAQPVQGGEDQFWQAKATQVGLGAMPVAMLRSPRVRQGITYLLSHGLSRGLVAGPAAAGIAAAAKMGVPHWALYPMGLSFWHGSPLWRLAHRVQRAIAPPMRAGMRRAATVAPAAGSAAGKAAGASDEEEANGREEP
jgi:hypothetical protein